MKRAREQAVRLNGRLLRVGEMVEVTDGPYRGRNGTFRGEFDDKRVAVNIKLGSGCIGTQLRLSRSQIRRAQVTAARKVHLVSR
jgi:hypothetical protein